MNEKSLTPEDHRLIDQRCDEFEAAWQSGNPRTIEEMLQAAPEHLREPLFHALLPVEIELCKAQGEEPSLSDYQAKFPYFNESETAIFSSWKAAEVNAFEKEEKAARNVPEKIRYLGDYELLQEIARGGMGIVYKAKQVSLNRIVAIKLILLAEYTTKENLARFRREAQAAANLKHPNIVAVHEIGLHDGNNYISMDYIEGESLADRLSNGPLLADDAVNILIPVANAIQYAHSREMPVIHRDLKPHNVLIDGHGIPYVTDFGLARIENQEESLTRDNQILGTPSYMPPEQAWGKVKNIDARADVYGLGAILYNCLTGQRPHSGASAADTIRLVMVESPKPVRTINSKVPKDLETICHKCLEKEPRHRYQTAQELADDLRRFQRGEPIYARPVGVLGRTWKWCKRHRAVASLLAAIVILLVAGTVVSTSLAIIAKQNERRANLQAELARKNEEIAKKRTEEVCDEIALKMLGRASQNLSNHERQNAIALATAAYRQAGTQLVRNSARNFMTEVDRQHSKLVLRSNIVGMCVVQNQPIVISGERAKAPANLPLLRSIIKHLDNGKEIPAKVSQSNKECILFDAITGNEFARIYQELVGTVAVSPDGRQIFIENRLFDLASGKELRKFEGHEQSLVAAVFSPKGDQILTSGEDNTVRLWDVITTKELHRFKGSEYAITFSSDGKQIAIGNRLIDSVTGKQLMQLRTEKSTIVSLAYSPDGKKIVTGSTEGITKIWDVLSGAELRTLNLSFSLMPLKAPISFSPDGNIVAIGADQTIHICDASTGEEEGRILWDQDVSFLSFSEDGGQVVFGNEYEIRRYALASAQDLPSLVGHDANVTAIAFSPDGTKIASSSYDQTIRLWDSSTYQELSQFDKQKHKILCIAFSPEGTQILSGGWQDVAQLWDVATGEKLKQFKGHKGWILSVAFSTDGRHVATGSTDHTVRLWDTLSGKERVCFRGHESIVYSISFSSDGKHVVSGSGDNTARLWNVQTGKEVFCFRANGGTVNSVAISPNGEYVVTASYDGIVRLWSTSTGKEIRRFEGHQGPVYAATFSPDGSQIVTGSKDDTVIVWDVATAYRLCRLQDNIWRINSVVFSPDGMRVAYGGLSKTIKFWEVGSRIPRKFNLVSSWGIVQSGKRVDELGYVVPVTTEEWADARDELLEAGVSW